MKIKFKENKKLILAILAVFFAPFLASGILGYYFIFGPNMPKELYEQKIINGTKARVQPIITWMTNLSNQAGSNLLFLSHLSSIKAVANDRESFLPYANNDFESFLNEHKTYYQIFYLDTKGQELASVFMNKDVASPVSVDKLQNRKDEIYFEQTLKLNSNEIYISDIMLLPSPQDISVIYYATPIVNERSEKTGILVVVINTDNFLNDIRSFSHLDEPVYLVNKDGYYLANPDSSKEFGFATGSNASFYKDYPNIKDTIRTTYDEGVVEDTNNIYTYRYVYPQLGKFEVYKGWERLNGKNSEKENYWILVTVTSKEGLIKESGENIKSFLSFIGISGGFFIFLDLFILFYILKTTDSAKLTVFFKRTEGP